MSNLSALFYLLQLLVIVQCKIEELNLSPDIWKDNENLLQLEDNPPDYLSQGYRISEAKCLENIWEVEQEENRIANVMKYSYFGLVGVTGGRKADPSEFPHMGALGWQTTRGGWSFKCGSFLISDQFLLTAAHCSISDPSTDLQDLRPKIVRLGVDNIVNDEEGRKPVDMKIQKFIKHPQYRGLSKRYNDIALIMLRQKVGFTKFVRPVCIMNIKTDKAIVTGWGGIDTGRHSRRLSDHLKAAEVDMIDSDTCNFKLQAKISKKWSGMQDYQFCATDLDGIGDICDGDSGGPVQVKLNTNTNKPIYNALGIASFGYICGNPNFPSVYTNVSSFIDWIEDTVWKGIDNPTTVNPISSNSPTFNPTISASWRPISSSTTVKPTTLSPVSTTPTTRPTYKPTTFRSVSTLQPTTLSPVSTTRTHTIFNPTTSYSNFKPVTFPPFNNPIFPSPNEIPFDYKPTYPVFHNSFDYNGYFRYSSPNVINNVHDISTFDYSTFYN